MDSNVENDVMRLSICMIVLNEEAIIHNTLENLKNVADEIVIVDGGSTDKTQEICKEYTDKVYVRKFDGDFSAQKNYATYKCMGQWIFNIDADESMSDLLKKSIRDIIRLNSNVELIRIPRINKVQGITSIDAQEWGYKIDLDGDINWPDFQDRLYRRRPEVIKWMNPVHEFITGYKTYANLTDDKSDGLYLIHNKDIKRQRRQNDFYSLYKFGIPLV